jgi:hypothetical protein
MRAAPAASPEERLNQEHEDAADRDAVHPLHQTQLGPDHGDVRGERDDLLLERSAAFFERGDAPGQGFKRLLDEAEPTLDAIQSLADLLKALVPALVAAGDAGGRGAPSRRRRPP